MLYTLSRDDIPESRIVRVVDIARTNRRVGIEGAVFVAEILPLEWRDILGVTFHDRQQIVADTGHWLWRRRLLAVMTYYVVIRLQYNVICLTVLERKKEREMVLTV